MRHFYSFFAVILAIAFLSSTMAGAATFKREDTTQPSYIVLLFNKMTGQDINFDMWVKDSNSYQKANSFDKPAIFQKNKKSLEDFYSLMKTDDLVYVDINVKMSEYNENHEGFFVKGFDDGDVFFTYNFMGDDYAIIPKQIENHQWLKVSPEDAAEIKEYAMRDENIIKLRMVLQPLFADKSSKFNIHGKDYWLIMADVGDLQIWGRLNRHLIWEKGAVFAGKTRELMEFYQGDE